MCDWVHNGVWIFETARQLEIQREDTGLGLTVGAKQWQEHNAYGSTTLATRVVMARAMWAMYASMQRMALTGYRCPKRPSARIQTGANRIQDFTQADLETHYVMAKQRA
jgi:hypothetical protein